MTDKLEKLLGALGLDQYLQAFIDNDIDDEVLRELADSDLRELGVSLGHRKKLLKAITAECADSEAEQISARPVGHEAERRQLTVMFCDLVSSTALSAQLDVEIYREIIARYQDEARRALNRFDGYIARYMGDGLLVYFGYPQAHEDDAERAIRAARAIVEVVQQLATPLDERLAVRVGIATGAVVAGDIVGEGASEEHAVLGKTPNLASRLQALAEPGEVVVASETRELSGQLFDFQLLGEYALKGFPGVIDAWRVVAERVAESRFAATRSTKGVPLVGRDGELSLLLDRWQRALDREGQVVYLSGEPGIGKSRLVHTLRQRIENTPHTVLQFQCSPYYSSSAFYPFIEQIQRAAGLVSDDDVAVRIRKVEKWSLLETDRPADTLPLVLNLLSLPLNGSATSQELSAQAQKERTAWYLVERISSKTSDMPTLVIFEDVHWADPTSLDVLGRLIDLCSRLSILLLITHRPQFTPPWSNSGQVTAHSLARLGKRQVTGLVHAVAGAKALPDAIVADIVSKTDGIPLFVEELTKTVTESELLEELEDRYELTGALPSLSIPSTLRDSLVSRLDRLGAVKEVAQMASVIGREFSAALLSALSKLSPEALGDALMQLTDAELVLRRDSGPEPVYVFKHALVQEAAYDSLLRRRREQLHADIVSALEEQFPETVAVEPELLAHHCARAGQIEEALEYWRAAAQAALEQSAYQESLSHLDTAHQSLEHIEDRETLRRAELELEIARGGVLMVSEGYLAPETEAAFSRARELAETQGDHHKLFAALRGLHGIHIVRAELDTALLVAQQCLEIAEAEREDAAIALACRLVGETYCLLGRLDEARQHLERSAALIETGAACGVTALVHGVGYRLITPAFAAHVLWLQGFPDQALSMAQSGLDKARHHHGAFGITASMYFLAWLLGWRREFAALSELVGQMRALAAEHKITAWESTAEILLDWPQLADAGSRQAGSVAKQRLSDIRSETGLRTPYKLGLLALALGDDEASLDLVDEALRLTDSTGERWSEAELHRIKGECLRRRADARSQASRCLERALELSKQQGARAWALRAAISLAGLRKQEGNVAAARCVLADVYGQYTEGFETQDLRDAAALLRELE